MEAGLPSVKCMEAVARSVDLVYGADDHGADSLRTSLTAVSEQLARLADALEKGEYDFDGSVPEKVGGGGWVGRGGGSASGEARSVSM